MILVVGSTGSLGTSVVRGLIASHHKVAALVRDAAGEVSKALRSAGAALVVGDLKYRSMLDAALRGIDTVICTANSMRSRGDGDSIATVDAKGVQNLIDATEAAGIKRFIFVSISPSIRDDFPLAAAKRAAERRLASSTLDYTLLQPSCFAEVWFSPAVGFDAGNGKVRVYGDGQAKVSYVVGEDVARAVIACLGNARASRKAIPIGGPKAISQLEAVALAERATGKKIQLEFMSAEQIAAARQGATDPMMQSFLGLFDYVAKGDEIPTDWARILGVNPQSMDEWISRSLH